MRGDLLVAVLVPVLGLSPIPAAAQAPQPFARASVETESPIVVGQPVTIRVDVLVPDFFRGAPFWPDLDVPDALTIFQWTGGTNFTEKVGPQVWAGQSRSYIVYPQKPGRYETSQIPIEVKYPAGAETVTAFASPDPVGFEAVLPPGARDLPYFIATTELDLAQTFVGESDTLHVGEAFRRTITANVLDAMGMVIPPLAMDTIPGLGVYREPPVVEETLGERGATIVGQRVETVTYIAEEEGVWTIPAVEVTWWDLDSGQLKRAELAAIVLTVLPATESAAIALPPEEADPAAGDGTGRTRHRIASLLRRWGPAMAFAGLVVWLLARLRRRFGPRIRGHVEASRRTRAESEATYFRAFQRAARSGDPAATWRTLTAWVDRLHSGPGAASVRQLVQASGDSDFVRQVEALDRGLFGPGGAAEPPPAEADWSPRELIRAATRWRRRRGRGARSAEAGALELNPVDPSLRPS